MERHANCLFIEADHEGLAGQKENAIETLPRIVMLSDSTEGLHLFFLLHMEA
jgi:hypothetical protein